MNQILSSPGGADAECGFSGAVESVESDLTLVKMVYVHETLTLIILARDITWHLKRECCLVEVVVAALRIWRERVENVVGAAGATINRSEAVLS